MDSNEYMFPYYLIANSVNTVEGKIYNMYGIKCFDRKNKLLKYIAAISSDKKTVEKIIDLLNRGKTSVYHFSDIIEDLL